MTLPIGSQAWFQAWSPQQRDQTVRMARARQRRITRWLVACLGGMLLGALTIATGQPHVDDLPPAPTVPATLALAVDAGALALSRAGWRGVEAVFTGRAAAAVLRSVRLRTALAALAALLVSLFAICWGGVVPGAALVQGEFGWAEAATGVAILLALAAGITAMKLWVNLVPVRQPTT